MLLHVFIHDEIIAFSILCAITGFAAALAFLKKPGLLGNDIVYIQNDLLQMFKKNKKVKKMQPAAASEEI
jgi:hypothetical protein